MPMPATVRLKMDWTNPLHRRLALWALNVHYGFRGEARGARAERGQGGTKRKW